MNFEEKLIITEITIFNSIELNSTYLFGFQKFQFRHQTKIEFNNYAHNNIICTMPTVNLSYDFIYYTIDNSIKQYCKDR